MAGLSEGGNEPPGSLKATKLEIFIRGIDQDFEKRWCIRFDADIMALLAEEEMLLELNDSCEQYGMKILNLQAEITDSLRHLPINVNDIGTINPRNIRKQLRVTSYNQCSALLGKLDLSPVEALEIPIAGDAMSIKTLPHVLGFCPQGELLRI
ncbi:hypothetical protein ANN_12655 [Periplaneta americana]|uniref:Uncharacterized protein n=1 Tax=Periplaneta americana TaxID=6978 RepID=A0ABQ8TJC3_PERAM|nr:hypothetical protein ANN_12655 [Periplaneta americana]